VLLLALQLRFGQSRQASYDAFFPCVTAIPCFFGGICSLLIVTRLRQGFEEKIGLGKVFVCLKVL
jgi:hypothetical protein